MTVTTIYHLLWRMQMEESAEDYQKENSFCEFLELKGI